MTQASSILLVDSNAGDSALATLVLQREMPHAAITPATDAMALADALSGAMPDAAVVAADLVWTRPGDLIATIKRRSPTTAIVLLGHDADLMAHALNPGIACDGLVRKTASGFLGLGAIVTEALERRRRQVEAAASEAQRPSPLAERSQQEMRDIALVFSHDLKEPLQQIARLARIGQVSDDPKISARSLQRVLDCTVRANDMLDGMLDYLRVAGRDAAPVPVDLNVCFGRAVENLRSLVDESHAVIHAPQLPTTVGDEVQLLHLFQNLLSNAIKFRGRERPAIDVSVEVQDHLWHLALRDNGIGIAPPFLERIFTMGQRLHTREEYPGTGIGLALCRRIVERHGGRIWAESAGFGGSTFHVLLPQAESQQASRSGGAEWGRRAGGAVGATWPRVSGM